MPDYFAPRALPPQGWRHNVLLQVNDEGNLLAVTPDASPGEAAVLAGPVVPAMPNPHSHAFQRAMAGLTEVVGDPQDSFWTWRDVMYRMVVTLSPDQVHIIALQLYIEMLKGGYSQVAKFHYLHQDPQGRAYQHPGEMALRISQAAAESGIGLTLLPVLYSYSGFGAQPAQPGQLRFIQQTEAYLLQHQLLAQHLAGQRHQRLGVCFHSLRAVDEAQMSTVLAQTDPTLPVHIHVAEQLKEVNDCLAWSGQRPVRWLLDHAPVDARWCLIHATHLDDGEITALARSGAVAGLCPATEANLGDGIFPATDYLPLGGRWGIGSDSHVSLDVVEELRWLEYGQRLRDRRRAIDRGLPRRLAGAGCAGSLSAIGPGRDGDQPLAVCRRTPADPRCFRRRTPRHSRWASCAGARQRRRLRRSTTGSATGGAMSGARQFSLAALPVTPWRNGGGVTREIASVPRVADGGDFAWRASIATIDRDGGFSPFPGVDRSITLISSDGVILDHGQGGRHALVQQAEPYAFSGDDAIQATLARAVRYRSCWTHIRENDARSLT